VTKRKKSVLIALIVTLAPCLVVVAPKLTAWYILECRVGDLMSDDAAVRHAALLSLERSDCQPEVRRLIEELKGVGWQSESAVRALAGIGERAVAPLIAALEERPLRPTARHWRLQYNMKLGVIRALGEIGDVEAIPAIIQAVSMRDIRQLSRYPEDPQEEVGAWGSFQAGVAEALAKMGEPGAEAMIEESKKWGRVPMCVEYAFYDLGDQGIIMPLVENIREPAIQETAVRVLGRKGDRRAVAALSTLLEDNSLASPYEVIWALKKTGGEAAELAIDTFIEEHRQELSEAARDYKHLLNPDSFALTDAVYVCAVLIRRFGTPEMARDFRASGNSTLLELADEWEERATATDTEATPTK
jgi:HEAT repeat protein